MKVVIVDDDPYIIDWLRLYLEKAEFQVYAFSNGLNLEEKIKKIQPNVILLDIMMPGMTGFELLEYTKISDMAPVIFMSAKDTVDDKVKGLKLGADDYLVKPFDIEELLARIDVILRRTKEEWSDVLRLGNLSLNLKTYEVDYKSERIHLPQKEIVLLGYLMKHKNQVFTRQQLFEEVWGFQSESDLRTVDVHIKRLRARFDEDEDFSIKTVWGVGYKIVEKGSL